MKAKRADQSTSSYGIFGKIVINNGKNQLIGVREQIETFTKDWCCSNILLLCLVKHSFQLVLINYLIRRKFVMDLI